MRFLLIAALALATCGAAVEGRADGYVRTNHYKKRAHSVYFTVGVGGHRYGWQHKPFIYRFPDYHCAPVCNHLTFWERVETQGQYPVRY